MADPSDVCVPIAALKVLIMENDLAAAHALAVILERAGMQAVCTDIGTDAFALKQRFLPDVVLIDLHSPDTDALAVLVHLVQQGDCGIIIVSNGAGALDRIVGLELGADDYVSKPPHGRELLARIRAVHRRVNSGAWSKPSLPAPAMIRLGRMTVDRASRSVQMESGELVNLTAAEFTALDTMLAANGAAVSRDALSEAALHHPWQADDRGVDQLIFNLRHKLADGADQQFIHSVRGAGYLVSRPGSLPGSPS